MQGLISVPVFDSTIATELWQACPSQTAWLFNIAVSSSEFFSDSEPGSETVGVETSFPPQAENRARHRNTLKVALVFIPYEDEQVLGLTNRLITFIKKMKWRRLFV